MQSATWRTKLKIKNDKEKFKKNFKKRLYNFVLKLIEFLETLLERISKPVILACPESLNHLKILDKPEQWILDAPPAGGLPE